MNDTLGDYCKGIERGETDRRSTVGLPVYVRIDGNRFSRFTRGMERPYDPRLSESMVEAMCTLIEDYHAVIGYTQSDEISLVLFDADSELPHGGKYQKLVSRLSSKATAAFTAAAMRNGLGDFVERQLPEFDARAFEVESLDVAAKMLHWRQIDAIKNSVSMAARSFFSHKALYEKNRDDMLAMMKERGVADFFAHYPSFFTRGSWARRVTEERMLTAAELARIPEQHRPSGPVLRSRVATFDLPPLGTLPNMVATLFPRQVGETAAAA